MGASESTPMIHRPAYTAPPVHKRKLPQRNEDADTTALLDSNAPSVVVPTNCVIKIFSMLDRDDLENARLVCRVWKNVIDGSGRNQMPRRPVEVVELSSHREYRIKCDAVDRVQTKAFKKYFVDSDITGIEKRQLTYKMSLPAVGPIRNTWGRRARRGNPADEEDAEEEEDEAYDNRAPRIPPMPALGIRHPPPHVRMLRDDHQMEPMPFVHQEGQQQGGSAGAPVPHAYPTYRFPCHHRFYGHSTRMSRRFRFTADHRENIYEKVCGRLQFEIYRPRNPYSSKIFTPPLVFYERLEWMLRNTTVRHLVFINFTFTDLFVEKMEEFFGLAFPIERVFVHNCSLKYLSVAKFHHFFGRVLAPQHFYFEHVRNILPAHFGTELFETPALLNATTIFIDGVFGRHARMFAEPLRLNFREEDLLEILEKRKEQWANNKQPQERGVFLGISHIRQSEDEIIKEYAAEYKRSNAAPHFFHHVVFGQRSFVGGALADVVQQME